ncbi:hypothetical protein ABVK25_002065 [Lepraria finkii]|uniref:Uncharacterized protein n=1 Tax=Lepraria finkii TaxID=1340010 RepID=A0ABR4BKY8_9LECA
MKPHHTQVGMESKRLIPRPPLGPHRGRKGIHTALRRRRPAYLDCSTTAVTASDVDLVQRDGDVKDINEKTVKAGLKYVKNIQGVRYGGPKPLMGHGPYRYIYQLVALKEPVDVEKLGSVTEDVLRAAIVERVVGWGERVGVYERK